MIITEAIAIYCKLTPHPLPPPTPKKFRTSLGFDSLCISAVVLYQLSYEDLDIGSRPICWIHLNPRMEIIVYPNFALFKDPFYIFLCL